MQEKIQAMQEVVDVLKASADLTPKDIKIATLAAACVVTHLGPQLVALHQTLLEVLDAQRQQRQQTEGGNI